jgi:hypothetical protein
MIFLVEEVIDAQFSREQYIPELSFLSGRQLVHKVGVQAIATAYIIAGGGEAFAV